MISRSSIGSLRWIEAISRIFPHCKNNVAIPARLVLFCDFCEGTHPGEVPDPYCGGPEDFEEVLDLLEDGCTSFLRRWQSGDSHENPGPVA